MSNPKFRFYDSKYKIMRLDTTYAVAFDGSVKLLSKYKDNESGEYHTCGNGIIPMQWTGLTDRLGVEIYEGDIVKGISYPAVCEVVFNDGSFWLIAKDWENTLGGMSADCEVIGNIWENGDLLKGEPNE